MIMPTLFAAVIAAKTKTLLISTDQRARLGRGDFVVKRKRQCDSRVEDSTDEELRDFFSTRLSKPKKSWKVLRNNDLGKLKVWHFWIESTSPSSEGEIRSALRACILRDKRGGKEVIQIKFMATPKQHERNGYAGILIDAVKNFAQKRNMKLFVLSCESEEVVSYWHKNGFVHEANDGYEDHCMTYAGCKVMGLPHELPTDYVYRIRRGAHRLWSARLIHYERSTQMYTYEYKDGTQGKVRSDAMWINSKTEKCYDDSDLRIAEHCDIDKAQEKENTILPLCCA